MHSSCNHSIVVAITTILFIILCKLVVNITIHIVDAIIVSTIMDFSLAEV